jgi:glycerol-3-phosphate acyltransferase PlsX
MTSRIAVDAMGGDHAPGAIVRGAVDAVAARDSDIEVVLVGADLAIRAELRGAEPPPRLRIEVADEVVGMDEHPVDAVRRKPNSSIVRAMTLLASGEVDAVISAGNTGAVVAAGTFLLPRLAGAKRAGIAAPFPSKDGVSLLMDVGATIRCKPVHLVQYAVMASVYAREVFQIEEPRVALLSIGGEDSKGGPLVRDAAEALRALRGVNFTGSVEGQQIFDGGADVILCEGFVGNVILKSAEGLSEQFLHDLLSELDVRLGDADAAVSSVLAEFHRRTDYTRYGGAPLLGHDGAVFICHGRSPAPAIRKAIEVADAHVRLGVTAKVSSGLGVLAADEEVAVALGGRS